MKPEDEKRLADLIAEIDDIDDEDRVPTTVRGGKPYQRLVESERPTVPPPKQSHVRALGGDASLADDTGSLPAIPRAAAVPKS